MDYGLYLSTAGAKSQSWRLDILANNIANVSSDGFRKIFPVMQKRPSHDVEFGAVPPFHPSDLRNMEGGLHIFHTPTDLAQGTMKATGQPLDLAIQGEGFFRIRKGNGVYLTRKGAFTLDSLGNVVTDDGTGFLLNVAGNPIRVPGQGPVRVTREGQFFQGNVALGQTAVYVPQQLGNMVHQPGTLFSFTGELQRIPGRVEQGVLEGSNVEPIDEMVELIEATRAFEININMVRMQDDLLGTLIENVPRLA